MPKLWGDEISAADGGIAAGRGAHVDVYNNRPSPDDDREMGKWANSHANGLVTIDEDWLGETSYTQAINAIASKMSRRWRVGVNFTNEYATLVVVQPGDADKWIEKWGEQIRGQWNFVDLTTRLRRELLAILTSLGNY